MIRMPFKFSRKIIIDIISSIGIIGYLSGRKITFLPYIPDWLKNQV